MQNINDQFFNGPYRDIWRQMIPAGLTEVECDLIEEVCPAGRDQPIADLMCGYGRHAIELARRGYPILAVDNDPVYTKEIRDTAIEEGLNIHTETIAVVDWMPESPVSTILCMGNSFAFFPEQTAATLLKRFSQALVPGGTFLLNTWMIGEIAIRHFKEKEWHTLPGIDYLIRNSYLLQPARIESEHILVYPDARPVSIRGVDHIFTLAELEKLMHAAGLIMETVYSTPRKKRFVLGDGRAYIIARKA